MKGTSSAPWMQYFAHEEARDQQGEFMEASASALLEGRTIIAEAPTGLGKTAAVLDSLGAMQTGSNGTRVALSARSRRLFCGYSSSVESDTRRGS